MYVHGTVYTEEKAKIMYSSYIHVQKVFFIFVVTGPIREYKCKNTEYTARAHLLKVLSHDR